MFIAETLFAVTVVCAAPKKSTGQTESNFYVLANDNGCSSFRFVNGTSLEQKMTDELKSIAGVGDVHVSRNGSALSIQVDVLNFDRATRRTIYAKEKELRGLYPNNALEIYLADMSRTPENAE